MDKAALLAKRLPEGKVELSVGTVTVRGLSRAETIAVQAIDDPATQDRKMLAYGLVDPQLDEDEVAAWEAAAPNSEHRQVLNEIVRLSRLTDSAPKEAVKSVRGRSSA